MAGYWPLTAMARGLPIVATAGCPSEATDEQRAALENLFDAMHTAVRLRKDLVLVCP
ncbi:MAG: hypothetical protein KF901_21705 [Myxococcales bacterium]|nr:hypothetical protein [Myxococcales bacterium]